MLEGQARSRILLLALFFVIAFSLLAFKLHDMQVTHYLEYRQKATRVRLSQVKTPAGRKDILDRNGTVLAKSVAVQDVYMMPRLVDEKYREDLEKIDELLKITPPGEDVVETYKRIRDQRAGTLRDTDSAVINSLVDRGVWEEQSPFLLKRDIPIDVLTRIEEQPETYDKLVVAESSRRVFPLGNPFSHVLGYMREIGMEQLTRDAPATEYKGGEIVGAAGLEDQYDIKLRDISGTMVVEVDPLGRFVGTFDEVASLPEELKPQPSQPGEDLKLTIDHQLQMLIHGEMQGLTGAVVVMNPQTGEILAMVSMPDFDNNFFTSRRTRAELNELFSDKTYPLYNRAVQSANPPGSIFKIVTLLAALESGKFNSQSEFVCNGQFQDFEREEDWRWCNNRSGHGPLDLSGALEQSCNVAFWKMAMELGSENLSHYAHLLGGGEPTGIDLPVESIGQVPWRDVWMDEHDGSYWGPGDTCNMSIGQGRIQMTPLQVVRLLSQVVNGGYEVHPHLWADLTPQLELKDGVLVPVDRQRIQGISSASFEFTDQALRKVVSQGIGWRVASLDVAIMGKTGTAQTGPGNEPHAWFASAAPYPKPTFAMVVYLEHGGESSNAVKVSKAIYEKVLANLAIFQGVR